jgi:catechol 2,3-dioxygenase-like lactoylglutathione lyase family enzyme
VTAAAGATGVEVGIVTADAEALAAFYTAGLGFTVEAVHTFVAGSVHRLRRGEARCKLYQPAGGVEGRPRPDPWYAHPGIAYGALLVDDAGAEVDRARAAGAEVLHPVASHRPGARSALIRDPEGNVWEILQER